MQVTFLALEGAPYNIKELSKNHHNHYYEHGYFHNLIPVDNSRQAQLLLRRRKKFHNPAGI